MNKPLLAWLPNNYWGTLGCAEDSCLLTSKAVSARTSNIHLESEELCLWKFLNKRLPQCKTNVW